MLTSERLLKIISIITILITLVFSTVVVITELMRPEKMFDRIVEDECNGKYSVAKNAAIENDLNLLKNACILIKENPTPFLKRINFLGKLENHHYLYIGTEGVLIKKAKTDFLKEAEYIHRCLRTGKCKLNELKDVKISVSGLMYDKNGDLVSSNTFYKTSLSQTAKGFKRLFNEIAKIKKTDLSQLALKLLFHHSYTFIENKEISYINNMLNKDTDGLYISSRGAKIRVLPFEYTADAMKILNKKGRQYGLKKDEYKNELAKIYLFRTSQYFENKLKMTPWEGSSALSKKDYSDNITSMFLRKHLQNALKAKKRYPLERTISNGKRGEKDASFFTQLSLAHAMINDSQNAKKILKHMSRRELSDLTASYLFNIIKLSQIDIDTAGKIITETAAKFSNTEFVTRAIKKNPVYSGFFLETHLLSTDSDLSTSELFDVAIHEFNRLKKKDQIRFIIYLGKLIPDKGSPFYQKTHRFINSNKELFTLVLYDSKGFMKTSGSISIKKAKPDTALSLAAASGLSALKKQKLLDRELLEIESGLGNFIKFMVVTGDDFPRWKDPKTKSIVEGGVRSYVGSQNIKLSNTIRAYSYFKNRAGSTGTQ